jgi:hypothetical protein
MKSPTPPATDPILARIVSEMQNVPGIIAMGLGGSRSIGTAKPGSDYDAIMFVERDADLDQQALTKTIEKFGGAWAGDMSTPLAELQIDGRKVEMFFRSLERTASEIELARKGQFRRTINPLHSIGFLSTIVISYVTYLRPLWDPSGRLKAMIDSAFPYPDVLRDKMINTFRTEARLALIHASKVNSVQDVAHLLGLYARAVAAWQLVLFAANSRYPVIDKGGRQLVAALPNTVANYEFRSASIFRAAAAGDLKGAIGEAQRIHNEVHAISQAAAVPPAKPVRTPQTA